MLGIVASDADPASSTIAEALLAEVDWETHVDESRPSPTGGGDWYRTDGAELRRFESMHLELEHPEDAFSTEPALLVFVSRHAGDTGPLLTGHFTGNFGPAAHGGSPNELAPAAPRALDELLEAFDRHAPTDYAVGIECTHHGPTAVSVPSLYAEVGSDESAWQDRQATQAVARAVLELRDVEPVGDRQVVGVGGPHYAPRFERILRETAWGVGHVCPDWALKAVRSDPSIVLEALAQSGAQHVLLDESLPEVETAVTEAGYRVVGEGWIREVDDWPLSLIERIEEVLGPVGSGVSLGTHSEEPFEVVSTPRALLDAAAAIDREAVLSAVAAHAVAFETREGGTRVGDRLLVPATASSRDLVEDIAALLEPAYDTVDVTDSAVTVEHEVFDPELAATLGVPEGPAYGRLAAGESVIVDGETIDPTAVHVTDRQQFPIDDEG